MDNTKVLPLLGGTLSYPSGWLVAEPRGTSADTCEYAGVMEVRNGDLYQFGGKPVPHILFRSPYLYARDYPPDFEEEVREACRAIYPDFVVLEKLEPSAKAFEHFDFNNPYDVERINELTTKLPQIGLFAIPVEGDMSYWGTRDNAPFGVIITKTKL